MKINILKLQFSMSLRGKQVYGDMNATNAVSFVGIMDDCFQISNIKVGCSKIK